MARSAYWGGSVIGIRFKTYMISLVSTKKSQ